MDATERPRGVWVPWARAICWPCHGRVMNQGRGPEIGPETWAEYTSAVPQPNGDGPATCQDCGASIWLRSDVALLRRVQAATGQGDLDQLGGMTCGLSIRVGDSDADLVLVTNHDAGEVVIGFYPACEPCNGTGWFPIDEDVTDKIECVDCDGSGCTLGGKGPEWCEVLDEDVDAVIAALRARGVLIEGEG